MYVHKPTLMKAVLENSIHVHLMALIYTEHNGAIILVLSENVL